MIFSLLVILATVAIADDTPPESWTTADLVEAALRYSPEYTLPVINPNGTPVAVYYDLNGDSITDIAILTVLNEPGVPTELQTLRETARLFRSEDPDPLFILETYFAGGEAVQTAELGRRPALGSVELLPLSDHESFPVGVTVYTRGANGGETNLLIYSPGGMIRRLELRETERERFQFSDLNHDGVLDIVVTRRLPEAGRGYETFVELWTISGNTYLLSGSFGLVRELRRFLDIAERHMLSGEWDALGVLVDPDGADAATILSRAFPGIAEDEETEETTFDYAVTGAPVSAAVFPAMMENPMPYPFLGTSIPLVFRVECCELVPRYYSAIIGLSENPFDEPRFRFLTRAGSQQ